MPAIQFAAESYTARSVPLLAARNINMFVERSPQDAKDQVPIFMCPGLSVWSRLGNGPISGLHGMAGTLYALSGGELFSINADGLATAIGQTSLGPSVSIADNNTQLVMVDGSVGWVYQPSGLNQVLSATAYSYTQTSLFSTAVTGATSIVVKSASGMSHGDSISILLDAGGSFATTISGAPSGNNITLAGALPSQATAGAGVTDTSATNQTIVIYATGKVAVSQAISITLDNGVVFKTTISAVSGVFPNLTLTLAAALPSQASAGAIATITSLTLAQITAPAFMPATTVVYFDDYFIFSATGTQEFFLSSLGDGTQYNGLDFASAQASPDNVLAIVNYHEQLLIFKQFRIEVWYDAGAANFPFERYDGAYIQRGLAGPYAVTQEDNTVFWLGDDGIFYRLNGYSPQRISQFGCEHAWAQYPQLDDVTAFVVTMEGHKFIFLTFPSGNATWCYDISSGTEQPLWHERESWGSAWV